jgi:hypothetical protein
MHGDTEQAYGVEIRTKDGADLNSKRASENAKVPREFHGVALRVIFDIFYKGRRVIYTTINFHEYRRLKITTTKSWIVRKTGRVH